MVCIQQAHGSAVMPVEMKSEMIILTQDKTLYFDTTGAAIELEVTEYDPGIYCDVFETDGIVHNVVYRVIGNLSNKRYCLFQTYDKKHAKNAMEAIRLHRLMWNELCDIDKKRKHKLIGDDRARFIDAWLTLHGYDFVENKSFLCEYAKTQANTDEYDLFCTEGVCKHCPLDWATLILNRNDIVHDIGTCFCHVRIDGKTGELWMLAPIVAIANLPERNDSNANTKSIS